METWANLVNDDLELELRNRIRKTMKGHNIIDGVFEADLVAAVKPVVMEWEQPMSGEECVAIMKEVADAEIATNKDDAVQHQYETSKLIWEKVSPHGRDIFAKTPFGDFTISKDSDLAGGRCYLWHPDQLPDADYFADFAYERLARDCAEKLYARLLLQPVFTGIKDKNDNYLFLGDTVRYCMESKSTKEEFHNPEYEIIWDAPGFTLKHIGGGKDGGSHDFILKYRSDEFERLTRGKHSLTHSI